LIAIPVIDSILDDAGRIALMFVPSFNAPPPKALEQAPQHS
jgi:hypothetical protein